MKNFCYLLIILLFTGIFPVWAASSQDEIVIEMEGPQTKIQSEQYIWDKSAKQLTKLFRGKNKKYVLQTIDAISSKEQQLTSSEGNVYQLVQYGQDSWGYRKFLFHNSAPQQFVTCAANAADIIAIFQRYDVTIGLRKNDFLSIYSQLEKPTTLINATTVLTLYTIPEKQLPLPSEQPVFAVFEGNRLVKLLNGPENLETYKKTLQPAPTPQRTEPAKQINTPQKQRKPYKALVSGGTVEDRMYMPRVINGPFTPKTSQNKSQTGK